MCDGSAGIDFFNNETEVIKIYCVDYKHDLKAITSYKFPYNDKKIIIIMNIKVQSISTCSNSHKYLLGTLCI